MGIILSPTLPQPALVVNTPTFSSMLFVACSKAGESVRTT